MKVYKACFKVIWKHFPALLIYLGVFLFMALLLTNLNSSDQITNYSAEKNNVVIFNDDSGSDIANGLKSYLAKSNTLVSIADNKHAMQDALFYYQADSILRIPAGFSKDLSNGTAKIFHSSRPNSTSSIYTDNLVNRYLNLANLYAKSLPGLSEAQIASRINHALQNQASIHVHTFGQKTGESSVGYYFTFLVYCLIAVLILSTSTVLFTFQKLDLRRRNLCTPLPAVSANLQQMLAISTFGLIVWAVLGGFGLILNARTLNVTEAILYSVNSLAVMLVGLGIGFLVSNLVKSDEAASAAANVASLGMSFLCGVFVPQSVLSKSVLNIAHFLPAYWYVRATNSIHTLSVYTISSVTPIIQDILIQLAFAVALCLISLLLYRQKQLSST